MSLLDKLFKGKSHPEIIADVINNLGHLAECEEAISEFYKLCAVKMEKDRGLWESLVKAEVRHADTIRKMVELIKASPEEYKPGHAFNPAAIRTFKMQIEGLIGDMRDGKITAEKLFDQAVELESSAMELSFMKIVDTKNAEFNTLARQIDADCIAHREAIHKKAAGQD